MTEGHHLYPKAFPSEPVGCQLTSLPENRAGPGLKSRKAHHFLPLPNQSDYQRS